MKLKTPVTIENQNIELSYQSQTMLLGSCFTENVGQQLQSYCFPVMLNPCGILYNPVSVAQCIDFMTDKQQFTSDNLVFSQELWHSWFHHGKFSHTDKNTLLQTINQEIKNAGKWLYATSTLFITFGTAWCYRLKTTGQTVANCHKLPGKLFERYIINIENIKISYLKLLSKLRQINPAMQVVFTVSPVRHWKDGAHGNQLSKSTLLLAIDEIIKQSNNTWYFPAYEIMMDELRDYRFYADDMLHPSKLAVNYIWERFVPAYIKPETQEIMNEVMQLVKSATHRPLFPESESFHKFRKRYDERLKQFKEKYNYIRLNFE